MERADDPFRLDGRVVLVTGAAQERGIGRTIGLAGAMAGAVVGLADVEEAGVEEAAQAIEDAGGKAMALPMDVTNPASVAEAVERLTDAYGPVDVLINNAGISSPTPLWEIDLEEFDRVMSVNARGGFVCLKAVLPRMMQRMRGRIVWISSQAGREGGGTFGTTHYAASKAAVIGLCQAAARELGPFGITSNAIAPGFVDTGLLARSSNQQMEDQVREKVAASVPLRRVAMAEGYCERRRVPSLGRIRLRDGRGTRCQRRRILRVIGGSMESNALDWTMETFRLDGKVAAVTGAGQGLGRAFSLALARAGAEVVLLDIVGENIEEVAREIEALGSRGWPEVCDVTDRERVAGALASAQRLDVLVNNAGTNITQPFLEVSGENLDKMLSLNVKGYFLVAQAAARRMIEAGEGGSIVNVTSQMGCVGAPTRTVYCSTKHAVEGLTKAMAVELAPRGVRVNSLAPTFVDTPLTKPMFEDEEFLNDTLSRIPLGRLGRVQDVMGAVVFLASPAAAMVTGASLLVDGGWTAQ